MHLAKKKSPLIPLGLSLILLLTSCSSTTKSSQEDILTQKVVDEKKTPLTILVKYAFSINAFEKAVETKFPEIDIIQVGNYTSNMGIAEYEARLEHDDLTDIVMNWPLKVGEKYWDERLIDLSTLPLTEHYNTAMLDAISKDGKLHYLPGPSQVRGIVYNKTMFKEKGWEVPKDFDGFLALCKEIEKSGIRSLQLGLGNSEVLDTAFTGYGFESGYSKPKNAEWITNYANGTGHFMDNFGPALTTFQTLIDEGVLKKNDLNVRYPDRERMFFNRECAMVEDSVLLSRMGEEMTGTTDEFALMPFFNPGEGASWSRLYPVCYIGLNKHLTLPENKTKYDLAMKLLEYISTPEGQATLSQDTGAMFSSLNGVGAPNIPEIKDLLPSLARGHHAVFPTLKNVQETLRKGLAGMVAGTYTADDVAKMVDEQNKKSEAVVKVPVIGKAKTDFTLLDTGNYITDVMRAKANSDIALYLDNGKDGRYNGKGVSGRLYNGDITAVDIERILPDFKQKEKGELWKVTMTGEDLITTLEHAISVDNERIGWFYYFSGLKLEFDPTATPGKRIHKITDDKGKAIDLKKEYTIAVMDESIPNEFIKSKKVVGILISTMLEESIQQAKSISPCNDHRFTLVKP